MEQDWINALAGGGLIGLSSAVLLHTLGRIAGISGIFAGVLLPTSESPHWRVYFVIGLLVGGFITALFFKDAISETSHISTPTIIIAGLLVGFGTRLGGGCTSGHGVCGISRLSYRSILATITFIVTGVITVAISSYLKGGAL